MNDNELVNFLDARVLALKNIVDVARGGVGDAQLAETGLQDCDNLSKSIRDLGGAIQRYGDAREEVRNAGIVADEGRMHGAQHALNVHRRALEESASNVARLLARWLALYGAPINAEGYAGGQQALFGIAFERGDACVRLSIDRYGMDFRECYPILD